VHVVAASPSTQALVKLVNDRFGSLRAQQTVRDFKKQDILANRELRPDPTYTPSYHPVSKKTALDVTLTPEVDRQLDQFLATGNYLKRKEDALLHTFLRWFDATWPRDRVATKLVFRKT
jgi:hypothetical protein